MNHRTISHANPGSVNTGAKSHGNSLETRRNPVTGDQGVAERIVNSGCEAMIWTLSHRADPEAVAIADRHYNRQKVGSRQFVPPGRCIVLKSLCGRALWVTSWPFAQYVKHRWAGAWVNSLFRNEGAGLSSDLIRQAIAVSKSIWEPPALGMITFVDAAKTKHKRDPGRCYRKAGFSHVGFTAGGLHALQLLPNNMPHAELPSHRMPLFDAIAPTHHTMEE